MSLETCHPASPRRAVDWRWRCATRLREGRLPAHPAWSDAWVERVVAFQETLDDPDGDPHRPRLAELEPALAEAGRAPPAPVDGAAGAGRVAGFERHGSHPW